LNSSYEQNFSEKDFFNTKKRFLKNYDKKNNSKFSKDFILTKKISFEKSNEKIFLEENRTLNNFTNHKSNNSFFLGLKKQQLFFYKNKPIYLVDNHNKALYAFLEISKSFKNKFNIIHIDAHRDDAKFQKEYPEIICWKNIN
jgi:arginase family enzyme